MPRREFDVNVDGLADLRRALRATDRDMLKGVQKALKASAEIVAHTAAEIAPRRTGHLAAGYRPFTRGNVAGVRNPVPYAGVFEYGGTIRPRGVPITIRRAGPIQAAIAREENRIVERVEQGLDEATGRNGWK